MGNQQVRHFAILNSQKEVKVILKDIEGYEGVYQISDKGEIYSVKKNKYLKLNHKKNGYIYVELNHKGVAKNYRVHRLVAQAFVPNPDNKPVVNHKDCDKSNNDASNLEWATISENTKHAFDNGLIISPNIKKYLIINNKDVSIVVNSMKELEELTGYGSSQICTYIKQETSLKKGNYKGCYIVKK